MTRSLTIPWPNHLLTLEEWEALPHEGVRLELVEGVVAVSPQPYPWHQFACHNLARHANDQLSRDLITLGEIEIVLADPPLTIRIPDLIVTHTARYEANPPRLAASDVLLAVEILSDGTRRIDRVLKFSEYAEAGIPQYWIIDLDAPTSLLAYALIDGTYELSGEHTGAVTLDVAGHPVALDLPALPRR
jgi:Uma2 family endonuclease